MKTKVKLPSNTLKFNRVVKDYFSNYGEVKTAIDKINVYSSRIICDRYLGLLFGRSNNEVSLAIKTSTESYKNLRHNCYVELIRLCIVCKVVFEDPDIITERQDKLLNDFFIDGGSFLQNDSLIQESKQVHSDFEPDCYLSGQSLSNTLLELGYDLSDVDIEIEDVDEQILVSREPVINTTYETKQHKSVAENIKQLETEQ